MISYDEKLFALVDNLEAPDSTIEDRYSRIMKIMREYDQDIILSLILIEHFNIEQATSYAAALKYADDFDVDKKEILTLLLEKAFLESDHPSKESLH